jgi:hypothetical protein
MGADLDAAGVDEQRSRGKGRTPLQEINSGDRPLEVRCGLAARSRDEQDLVPAGTAVSGG